VAAFISRSSVTISATLVMMSGSLPPGIDPGRELIRVARSRGVRVILDASGRPFRAALPAAPFLVKPNRDELEEWAGEPIPTLDLVVAAARRLLAGLGQLSGQKAADELGQMYACVTAYEELAEVVHVQQPRESSGELAASSILTNCISRGHGAHDGQPQEP
jgi:hypothetical protein